MSFKDDLIKAGQPKPVEVEIEALDGKTVKILPMTSTEDEEHVEDVKASPETGEDPARDLVMSRLLDLDENPVFDPDDEEDVERFMSMDPAVAIEVYQLLRNPTMRQRAKVEGHKGNLRSARKKRRH